ncbi:MAG: carbonic anhydrase [Gammaproteobacteria bacterium]
MMKGLEKLIAGFRQFRKRYYEDEPELYKQLITRGQAPTALIIACCDSRVHPAHVMDTNPGDIFVVRNVANLVPPYVDDGKTHGTSAAIEFALKHLKVPHVVVMGHSQCGGIRALMASDRGQDTRVFIDPWMAIMAPARARVEKDHHDASPDEKCSLCERAAISVSLANLRTFPFIPDAISRGTLQLHGWYFDIEHGILFALDESSGTFTPVE